MNNTHYASQFTAKFSFLSKRIFLTNFPTSFCLNLPVFRFLRIILTLHFGVRVGKQSHCPGRIEYIQITNTEVVTIAKNICTVIVFWITLKFVAQFLLSSMNYHTFLIRRLNGIHIFFVHCMIQLILI